MKILVISDVLWRNDNSVGNSYSNIFQGIKDIEVENICCQEGLSDNNISCKCFQISERRLLKNLLNPKIPTGVVETRDMKEDLCNNMSQSSKIFSMVKRSRLQIFFWMRNAIWYFGRWKSDSLLSFVDEFDPDIIFAQLQDKLYQNRLVDYVTSYTKCPLVLYAWDDVYSLQQFSLSPLYWIDRFTQRRSIRKLVKKCSLLYTISKEQQEEYEQTLHVKTKILFKGYKFDSVPHNVSLNNPIKILYTGNLYSGRYRTLLEFCKMLEQINQDEMKAQLLIYSGTPLSQREQETLNIAKTSKFYGKISEREVQKLQNEADILLHIEPMTLKGSLLCRLSFSTKLVDYFHNRKCIFAVGHSRCSSIRYLKRNQAAVVATDLEEMATQLRKILDNKNMIEEYADYSWKCGVKNHDIDDIQNNLLESFKEVMT